VLLKMVVGPGGSGRGSSARRMGSKSGALLVNRIGAVVG
jgi:hypothetical protein